MAHKRWNVQGLIKVILQLENFEFDPHKKEPSKEMDMHEKREGLLLSLRVELKTSRLLNGCSNQLSYES